MQTPDVLEQAILNSLDDMKAIDVVSIDVKHVTSTFDKIIICSGTSNRHVKSIAEKTVRNLKDQGLRAMSMEGENTAEWVLIDYVDIVVHVMKQEVRDYYQIERLWSHEIETGEFTEEPPSRL